MPTKKKQKQKQTTPNQTGKGMSYKDFMLVYFQEGLAAAQKLIETKKVAMSVARHAVELIQKNQPDVVSTLGALLDKIAPVGKIGKEGPKVGMTRDYSVQGVKGSTFIRTPLATLGVKKKDEVSVTFEAGRILIAKKTVAATRATG